MPNSTRPARSTPLTKRECDLALDAINRQFEQLLNEEIAGNRVGRDRAMLSRAQDKIMAMRREAMVRERNPRNDTLKAVERLLLAELNGDNTAKGLLGGLTRAVDIVREMRGGNAHLGGYV